MTKRFSPQAASATVLVGTSLLLSLTGCVVGQRSASTRQAARPVVMQAQASVNLVDDYDYYPGYETYYSRSRREFVYREGNTWVRRSQPRGVSIDFLFSTPMVQLDFHDSPEYHNSAVVQSYPRNWTPPGRRPEPRDERRDERGPPQRGDPRGAPVIVATHDDYDYYPGYETYYNRERREYVYREGNTWVHRSEPKNVRREVLVAAPVVRMDFHDTPEQHHAAVVKQYPKNWKRQDGKRDDKDERKDERDDDKRDRKDNDKDK